MFKLYCSHRDQTPGVNGQAQRCPEIDYHDHIPTLEQDEHVKASFTKIFITQLFVNKTRMTRKSIEDKMAAQIFDWLQPHHLRLIAYDKFESTTA